MSEFMATGYNPARGGCTEKGCGTQQTYTLCGRFGRRCRAHAPWVTLGEQGRGGLAYWTLMAFTNGRAS